MTARDLHLSLQAGADVPCHLSWRIEDGVLRIISSNDRGDPSASDSGAPASW